MNDNIIQTFADERFGAVRALAIDSEPWFVARDVCDALGLGNVGQALSRLDEDEKSSITLNDGTPGNPNKLVVNEPGLYTLVLSSRKPEAHAFKRWVTHDVLPALRRDGAYVASDGTEDDATLMARALLAAKRQMDAKDRQLREQRERIVQLETTDRFRVDQMTRIEGKLDKQSGKMDSLSVQISQVQSNPAREKVDKWDKVTWYVLTAVIGAIVGAVLTQMGLG